jgi:glycosyltransferase involved in cell wall biosynthesis
MDKRNLLIDIQMVTHNLGGGLTFIKNTINSLFKIDPDFNIIFIANKNNINLLNLNKNFKFEIIKPKTNTTKPLKRLLYSYMQIKLLDSKFNKNDILWLPFNTGLPVRTKNLKTVVTLHDLLAFDRPDCVPFFNRIFRKFSLEKSISNCDAIICVSEFTKQQLYINFYDKLSEKIIEVVPESVDSNFWSKNKELNIEKKDLFFLGVGRKNKNLQFLIKSFSRFQKSYKYTGKLIIAGNVNDKLLKTLNILIKELNLTSDVEFKGYVSDEQVKKYYQECDLFIFPSTYEGFGLPILEAKECGAKVCSSNAASLSEVGEKFAYFFNPFNQEECAKVMDTALKDNNIQDITFSGGWDESTARIINIFNRTKE